MVGCEDDRALELGYPFAALNLGMGDRLGEREEKAVLDQPQNGAHRLLTRPAEIAGRGRYHRASLRPRARAWRVPTPAFAHALDVANNIADGARQLHGPAVAAVPGHRPATRLRPAGWAAYACASRSDGGRRSARPSRTHPRAWSRT